MRADICDPDDEVAVECFASTLKQLGAKSAGESWGIGVEVQNFQIGEAVLTVFSDSWSIDIEGPEQLVQQVLQHFNQLGRQVSREYRPNRPALG
jgi:hypothetical protein